MIEAMTRGGGKALLQTACDADRSARKARLPFVDRCQGMAIYRVDPDYIRATGFVAGQVAGALIVWFSLLDGDPPLLRLRGLPLLAAMMFGVSIGSLVGWYVAHRIARRWLD
jgi:hypothetical protein